MKNRSNTNNSIWSRAVVDRAGKKKIFIDREIRDREIGPGEGVSPIGK